jgi:ferrochelatase
MPDLGVLLMTYGSPASLDDVPRYMTAVRGGRVPEPELLTEFRRRYEVIGGSPLVQVTSAQAAALQAQLDTEALVRAGMRFSHPTIEEQLRELAAGGVRRVVAIVLSPQYSPLLMGGYGRAIDAAIEAIGPSAPFVAVADAWHLEPDFVGALAHRIGEGLERLPAEERTIAPVLLTAHSLPRRVAEQEPSYLDQLTETATAVAQAAGLERDRWRFCWQSAGHEPGEWMKPDFADLMPELAAAGHRSVLVAPVQFLSDHLEVLYDIDVGAREQAEEHGLVFARIESLNVDPQFIRAMASVARRTAATIQTSSRPATVA